MMIIKRNQRGIGLLELMLSLAIIAILLIMATRYYLVTSRSQKVDEGTELVTALVAGAEDFKGANITFDKSSSNKLSIEKLIDQGSIAQAYVDPSDKTKAFTPWGSDSYITVTQNTTDATRADIVFKTIPATACNALANKFTNSTCTATGDTGTGDFTYIFPETTSSQP